MAKPTIGIVGLGSIGLRHKQNFEALGCKTVGHDPELGVWGDIWLRQADAVVICAPSFLHCHYITSVTGRNQPMLVEKPIVMRREEWETVPLSHVRMVGYNLRYRVCVQEAREWMSFGRIGKPLWARFTCSQYNCKPAYLRDGVVLNWSHEIDLALHLLGHAEVVASHCNADESIADMTLKHQNGCLTQVHLDYVTTPEQRDFIIAGDDGVIKVDIVQNSAYLLDKAGTVRGQRGSQYPFDQDYVAEAKAFIALINDTLPVHQACFCTAKEAMEVVDICLKVKENVTSD